MNLKLSAIIVFSMVFQLQNMSAQQVVSSGGNFHESDHLSISWTLGEPVTETFQSGNLILTQGFQQPTLRVSTIAEQLDAGFRVNAFPNPTKGLLNISTNIPEAQQLAYRIYDLQGRVVLTGSLHGKQTPVYVEEFLPGTYFMRIIRDYEVVKVFKVVKQ